MNNSQQNIFHILRQQQLKKQQQELEKVRLSKFPDKIPSPPDLYKIHPETLETRPRSTRQEYEADTNVPKGYTVGITTPDDRNPSYHGIHLDRLPHREGRQYDPSFTNFSMFVPGHILSDTFKVLHHLFAGHSNLFGEESQQLHNGRDKPDILRYPPTEEDDSFSIIHTPTVFKSKEDLIEHMPKVFTSLLLSNLNSRDNFFSHAGQDEIEELGKLKRGEESETDIPEDDESYTRRIKDDVLEKHDSIIREYAPILKDYVKHILEEKSPSTLHDFIGSHKSRNFGILSMLQDLLGKNKE